MVKFGLNWLLINLIVLGGGFSDWFRMFCVKKIFWWIGELEWWYESVVMISGWVNMLEWVFFGVFIVLNLMSFEFMFNL